jgi:ubiquinone/menaquinone biosynthesis C-methylase UbiE
MRVARLWWRLVRFGFRLLYNEFAFTYDIVSKVVSLGAWRCWQRSALKHVNPDGLILELAHGTGDLQIDLASAGYNSIGFDLSPYMGQIARRKLLRRGMSARLARGAAQALPFADGQFASVVSTFPSEFIAAPETLREVWRVLRSDGVLVIVPGAAFSGGGVAKVVLEWAYRVTGQRQPEQDQSARFAEWFANFGFSVEVRDEPCPRSVVLVIVARRQAANSP